MNEQEFNSRIELLRAEIKLDIANAKAEVMRFVANITLALLTLITVILIVAL